MARAFLDRDDDGEFDVTLAGPLRPLAGLGIPAQWGHRRPHVVRWDSGRLSPWADLAWPSVGRAAGDSVWYFPHWDMPWLARPRRSVVLVSDVIPLVVPGATSPFKRKVAKRWIRRSAVRATQIAVSTAFTRSELIAIWPDLADKTTVVPLGVDRGFFETPAALPQQLRSLVDAGPFMLSVGNRKTHKNLVMGPEVLARVPDIRWLVVGESFAGWESVMQRAATLGVSNRIHVLESQPDPVVHALYAASVCLFFPSRNEGFGLPILEALAAGTRVVVGNAGASVEVLGGHGAVCDVDDPDGFAAAVSSALSLGRPGPAGRTHAMSFTWERSARVLAEIIREIAR
jgi:glycosyltransferase involved in cell wall biosynthesis